MRTPGSSKVWWVMVATAAAALAPGCIPPLKSRSTSSLPVSDWVKPGSQSRPSAAMVKLARSLRGSDDLETIRNIHRWVRAHQRRFSGSKRGVLRRRTAAELFASGTYSGCADRGLVLASLFRAAGLPTVYVSSVLKQWVRDKADSTAGGHYRGHNFLEVHTSKGWVIVDSTRPLLWTGYDPKDRNLPRGHYVLAKGYDSWDMGIRSQRHLLWHMDELVERVDPSRFHEVHLQVVVLDRPLVVVTVRSIARALRRAMGGVPIKALGPSRIRGWLSRCHKCRGLALLPADLRASLASTLFGVVGKLTDPHRFEELVRATPRFLPLSRGGLCLYVRRSVKELVRAARRHSKGPITAKTCR